MTEDTFRSVIAGGVAISTLCIVVVAITAIMMYRSISAMKARSHTIADRVEPLIDTVRRLTDDSAPKIANITSDAAEIVANAKDVSAVAKEQAHRFAEVGRDFTDRAKVQLARVDAAVDQTVENVQHVSEAVKTSVLKPVREAGAMLAGVKAAVTTYAANGKRPPIDHIAQDEEMFI
jgi:methyl-accepting chemotaxis protein